ncbi:MAG: type II toxin-antitoxin system RelB/DinJ family antitoxin [Clostridiales bacterium]|jgi:addiction module RelB/DinJ family antitoxin|nr:type II toxin-antitoxin system RelB/DinJ family antitoxin [Clostridiales bacterium]
MPTRAITVRVDNAVKEQAERMLEDIGINMTTYIASSLKALVRERRVPFKMVTTDYLTDQIIIEKLKEAEKEAADPNAVWLSREEVFEPLRKKYGY